MKPRGIRIHCSASEWGRAELIDTWHKRRGFSRDPNYVTPLHPLPSIGYHAIILNGRPYSAGLYDLAYDGMIEWGRREDEIGAHARGDNDCLGVCLIGNRSFTRMQMSTLHTLLLNWGVKYNLPIETIKGHYETKYERERGDNKTCPNFEVSRLRDRIRGYRPRVQHYIGGI